jgi:phosphoribosylformylglycinamidine cyclo-ligase
VIRGTWETPPIFRWLERNGPVEPSEMASAFNLGLGMIVAVPSASADRVVTAFRRRRLAATIVGEVVRGNRQVEFVDG